MGYELLANLVLFLHAAYIGFVVLGLALILLGGCCKWRWVRQPWFRIVHLAAIGIVVLQAWFGIRCPLTVWETQLRQAAGKAGYPDGFIAYFVHDLIFYEDVATWVFTLAYTLFGILVLSSFVLVPPVGKRQRDGTPAQ